MILTCPQCATRYFVDDAKLGADGRTVRCAGCGSTWQAKAEPVLELVTSPEEGAVGVKPAAAEPEPPAIEPLPKVFRAKAVEKKSMRQAMIHGVVWAGMAAILALVLGAAALFRVDVVRTIPRAAGAYAMVGLKVNPTGLVFEGIRAHPALQDGHSALVISGSIRNVQDRAVTAPAIRIHILDKAGKPVAAQDAATENPHLKPGEARHFVVSVLDPPATAENVEVAFAFETKARPPAKAKAHVAPQAGQLRGEVEPEPLHPAPPVEAHPLPPEPAHAEPHADGHG